MDIISYKLAQQYANNVAAGFSRVEVNGTKINFTLNDGKTATVTIPTPADGASISNVSINSSKHLICTLSSGNTIDAGEVPNIKGDPGKDGKDGTVTPEQIESIIEQVKEEVPPYDDKEIREDIVQQSNKIVDLMNLLSQVRDALQRGDIDEAINLLDTFLLDEGVLE